MPVGGPFDVHPFPIALAFLTAEKHPIRAHSEPQFDAMVPEQEALVVDYCAKLAELAREGRTVDPVTLLEWAQALYKAEMFPPGPIVEAHALNTTPVVSQEPPSVSVNAIDRWLDAVEQSPRIHGLLTLSPLATSRGGG